jgi:hypothetical protein
VKLITEKSAQMKKYLTLTLLLVSYFGFSQTTIFDVAGGGTNLPAQWVGNNNVTATLITQTGNNYFLLEAGSNPDNIETAIIDLSAYSSAFFTFNFAPHTTSGTLVATKIEISYDGTTYTQLNLTALPLTAITYLSSGPITLTSALTNSIKIRISNSATSGRSIRLQSLKLVAYKPSWDLGGSQVAAIKKLGTTDNFDLPIITNNTEKLRIMAGGNVGIGNTTPSEKLDVTGNIKFSGALMPNNTAGTAGQVLTSAGTGAVPIWTTPATPTTDWALTGNALTDPSTHFIGTTDAQRLVIKTNNTEQATVLSNGNVGIGLTNPTYKLDVTGNLRTTLDANINGITVGKGTNNIATNTALGFNALLYSTATQNTAVGYNSGSNYTTGNQNTSVGYASMTAGAGSGGVGIGSFAMQTWVSGNYNIGIGYDALHGAGTGAGNIGIGRNVLGSTLSGSYNVGLGYLSLNTVTSGASNIGIGYFAGNTLTTGTNNIFIGTSVTPSSATVSNELNIGNWIYGASGNIGIATATPSEKLDVNGNVRFSGALMPNNAAGTAGQVLTSAGAGAVPTWSTPAVGSSDWALTGNASTNPATHFIGTTDAQRLVIKTNNTEQLTVLTNGNVGIGITTPTEKLHVAGNAIVSGTISSPGTGSGSEKFGLGASVAATDYSFASGYLASTTGNESVAIGSNSHAAYISTAIGSGANATGAGSTIIGRSGNDNGTDHLTSVGANITYPGFFSGGSYLNSGLINIGYNNSSTGHNYTYLIGANLTTDRNNQMLIGYAGAGAFLSDIVLGGGLSNELAANYGPLSIRTTDGSGANSAGMSLVLKGGKSTGSAAGGYLSFYTTAPGTSGSSVNTEQERMRIDANGAVSFNGSAGTSGQVLTSAGTGATPTWTTPASVTSSAWGLTGNNLTDPAINFIGTTDDQRLVIKTNNAEQLTVLTNGNVGIGISSPAQRLDVNGKIQLRRIADADAGTILRNSNTLQFQSAYWDAFSSASVANNWTMNVIQSAAAENNSIFIIKQHDGIGRMRLEYDGFKFLGRNGNELMNYTETTGRMNTYVPLWTNTITNTGQIGTTSVGGMNWDGNKIIFDNGPVLTYQAYGDMGTDYTAHRFTVGNALTGVNSLLASWDNGGSPLVAITKDGKLGIGLTAATEKLDVNGNIYTNGKILINQANTVAVAPYALAVNGTAIFTKAVVKLNNAWPDYVFEDNFRLLPIPELEKFIKENHRLPDVPGANDVSQNGIDLGGNQSILLKKVEELTLYMIELNKKIDALSRENELLKKK